MKEKSQFEKIQDETPLDIQIFVEKSFSVIDEIDLALESIGENRAFLANKLTKNDSEISKWFSGLHNLTLKTISKIEAALGLEIITTPSLANIKNSALIANLKKENTELKNENRKLSLQLQNFNSFKEIKTISQWEESEMKSFHEIPSQIPFCFFDTKSRSLPEKNEYKNSKKLAFHGEDDFA